MLIPDKTIDHGTLRRLVDAGARIGAEVVGSGGRWGIVINHGRVRQTLAATRGQPKNFRQFETLASYLKQLGIVEYRVNAAGFDEASTQRKAPDRRSAAASERMKHAHEAAAYNRWFREQVQASMDDPRPSLGHEEAQAHMSERRRALLRQAGKKAAVKAAPRV